MKRHRISIVLWIFVALVSGRAQTNDLFGDAASLAELLDTEISTASKYKQSANDAPASVTVITSDDIARYGYRNIAEALDSVRGQYHVYDHISHRVGSRGVGSVTELNHRMLVLLNGQVLNEWLGGSAMIGNASPIILDTVERIEIMRGPGSALYGTNAMFLVVNIITRDGARLDGGQASVSVGQEAERVFSGMYGASVGDESDAVIAFTTTNIDGSDYYSAFHDATAVDVDQERYTQVFASLNASRFRSHAFFVTRHKQLPTGAFGATFGDPNSGSRDERIGAQVEFSAFTSPTASAHLRGYVQAAESVARFVNAVTGARRFSGDGGAIHLGY
ncbi:MAG: TonB-dependent receptor plug domain-containing protein [Candidatus Poribacteria bacterium]|nr:TonB-dependent receptor plug domain-containing protein [Candidatus Poribacteria bacterium]